MNSYIEVPNPTPAIGDYFEGGFYTGMIWVQLVQSTSLTTIDTGIKSFTVPDMTDLPIVYEGQWLEIRSRTNPHNKMVGTVISASGTTLTINVTSINESGTFDDWSIMTRYRIIVAPKKDGTHDFIALKNTNSAFPIGCQTLNDGWVSTNAMKHAGNAKTYPAAWWARELNINGYNDWYIPARDELELCWRNLRPTNDDNQYANDRPIMQSFNYANNGSYNDSSDQHGVNNNSSPIGVAYTSGEPSQTKVSAFKIGGVEALNVNRVYWSSTEYQNSYAWFQYWYPDNTGSQGTTSKNYANFVLVVRRSII